MPPPRPIRPRLHPACAGPMGLRSRGQRRRTRSPVVGGGSRHAKTRGRLRLPAERGLRAGRLTRGWGRPLCRHERNPYSTPVAASRFPPLLSSLPAPNNTRPGRHGDSSTSWAAKCCSASALAVRAPSPCRFGSRRPGLRSLVPVPAVRAVHVSRILAEALTSTDTFKKRACFDQK